MTEHVPGEPYTTAEILSALAEEVPANDASPDRIDILRATDLQYMCRVQYPGESDYDSVMLLLE